MVEVVVPRMQGKEILLTASAGLALVAGVLAAITTGVAWASDSNDVPAFNGFGGGTAQSDYRLLEVKNCFNGSCANSDWSDNSADDVDGIGLIRASGPLMIVGIVVTFLAMATLTTSLFVRDAFLTLSGSIAAAVGFIFVLLALVFFPVGLDQAFDGSGQSPSWGAGLVLAIIAGAASLGATATGFTARFTGDLS